MLKIAIILVVAIALAQASSIGYGRGYGGAAPSFHEYEVNAYQAHRQRGVNARAEAHHSGTGTADFEGVPGTPDSRHGYRGYGRYY